MCTTNRVIMACGDIKYHFRPVSGCPSCPEQQHRTNNYVDRELARCMAQSNDDAFAGWQTPCKAPRSDVCDNSQQSVTPTYARLRILALAMEPVARLHPRTRNNGNAAPAKQEPDMTQEEIDTDKWLTNWIKTRDKCTQALQENNCLNLAAVMAVLCESCGISKTRVATSGFELPTIDGRNHHGLFVKGNCVVQPGDICAVMCSSEERFHDQPIDRQSYHIHAQNNQPGYYVVFLLIHRLC